MIKFNNFIKEPYKTKELTKLIKWYEHTKHIKKQRKVNKFNFKKNINIINNLLLAKKCNDFNSQSITFLVCGTRNLGFNKKNFPFHLLETILDVVEKKTDIFNEQDIAMTLLALAQMGIKWITLQKTLQEALMLSVQNNANKFNPQGISNTLFALKLMELTWNYLEKTLQEALMLSIKKNADKFKPQGLALTLLSLNQMGLTWNDLEKTLQKKLMLSVQNNTNKFNPQDISNILLALSQMKLKWADLEHTLQEKLLLSIEKNADKFNSQGISNILSSLNRMEVKWNDLGKNLQEKLMLSVEKNVKNFNPQDITMTLFALSQMGMKWSNIKNTLQEELLLSLEENVFLYDPQKISMTLLALNQIGIKWYKLENTLQIELMLSVKRNIQNFNSQDISNTLLALSRFDVLNFDLLKELIILYHNININKNTKDYRHCLQIYMAIVFFAVNKNLSVKKVCNNIEKTKCYGLEDIKNLVIKYLKEKAAPSTLQIDVLKNIQKYFKEKQKTGYDKFNSITIEHEVIIECFSVDIYIPKYNLIVEVNGPFHYLNENEITNETFEKERVLRILNYRVCSVSYFDWDKLINDTEKQSYIDKILNKYIARTRSLISFNHKKSINLYNELKNTNMIQQTQSKKFNKISERINEKQIFKKQELTKFEDIKLNIEAPPFYFKKTHIFK